MAEYLLNTDAFIADYRKRLIGRLGLFAVVLTCWCFYYSLAILHESIWLALFPALFIAGVMAFQGRRNLRQQQAIAESYRLLVTPDSLTRNVLGTPTHQVQQADIERIEANTDGLLTVVAHDKSRSFQVPAQILHQDELRLELSYLCPITMRTHKSVLEKIVPFTSIIVIVLMGAFYTVENKISSTITGGLLLALLSWSGWHIWHNRTLPKQTRRLLWFLPMLLFSILAGIIVRLLR